MNINQDLIRLFPPQYFWDVDQAKLNAADSKRLIIERIMNYGSMKEINGVIDHYGRNEVIKTIRKINYMDPKTLNFVSRLFDIPKSSFRCCTRKSLKRPHWNS